MTLSRKKNDIAGFRNFDGIADCILSASKFCVWCGDIFGNLVDYLFRIFGVGIVAGYYAEIGLRRRLPEASTAELSPTAD